MQAPRLFLCGALMFGTSVCQPLGVRHHTSARAQTAGTLERRERAKVETPEVKKTFTATLPVVTYRLDAGRSSFTVRTFSGGLLWFRGHDHLVAVRDFDGEAQLTPGALSPASLRLRVRADSLAETRAVFTERQKQIINREMRELVLETAKYPEIIFRSTGVTVRPTSGGEYEARIEGDLTLHGVTRRLTIPARVTLSGTSLRARGEFTVRRSDYNIKATSAFHGTVRVRDKLKFTFDITAYSS